MCICTCSVLSVLRSDTSFWDICKQCRLETQFRRGSDQDLNHWLTEISMPHDAVKVKIPETPKPTNGPIRMIKLDKSSGNKKKKKKETKKGKHLYEFLKLTVFV